MSDDKPDPYVLGVWKITDIVTSDDGTDDLILNLRIPMPLQTVTDLKVVYGAAIGAGYDLWLTAYASRRDDAADA